MAEAPITYYTLLDDLECVVCNEPLCDPRALPCGHCYCGPPFHLFAVYGDWARRPFGYEVCSVQSRS